MFYCFYFLFVMICLIWLNSIRFITYIFFNCVIFYIKICTLKNPCMVNFNTLREKLFCSGLCGLL